MIRNKLFVSLSLFILLLVFISSPASSEKESEAIYGELVSSLVNPVNVTREEIRKAVGFSAITGGWTILEDEDNRITMNLVHRGYHSTLTFVLLIPKFGYIQILGKNLRDHLLIDVL